MRKLKLAMLFALAFSPCMLHGLEGILSQIRRGKKYPIPAVGEMRDTRTVTKTISDPTPTNPTRTKDVDVVEEFWTPSYRNAGPSVRALVIEHKLYFQGLRDTVISRDYYFKMIDNVVAAISYTQNQDGTNR